MSAEDSRTFSLDQQLVADLASPEYRVCLEALAQLPDGLSRTEVSDIGFQVSMVPGVQAVCRGEKLKRRAIFLLGNYALLKRGDLVTATNASRELLSHDDVVGWFVLANRTRKARRQIVKSI